jgi:hypothetical protein
LTSVSVERKFLLGFEYSSFLLPAIRNRAEKKEEKLLDRPGNLPGGLISEVMNLHSQRLYVVSTAPEIGQDYWTTAVLPVVEKKSWLGLVTKRVPDAYHQIVAFVRNSRDAAHQVHAQVRHVVAYEKEENWLSMFPPPTPPDGYSEGAKQKLRSELGDDVV